MTRVQITLPVPGTSPAVLTLPQALTPQALLELERTIAGTLGMLRRDLSSVGSRADPGLAMRQPDAADIEYASWTSDPGAIELASWAAHMRAPVRCTPALHERIDGATTVAAVIDDAVDPHATLNRHAAGKGSRTQAA